MVFLSFLAGVAAFYSFQFFPYITAIAGVAAALALSKAKKPLLILLIALGFLYAFVRHEDIPKSAEVELSGVFVSSPIRAEEGFSQMFRVESATEAALPPLVEAARPPAAGAGDGKSIRIYRELINVYSGRQFEHGRWYRLGARLAVPDGGLSPGGPARPYAVLKKVLDEGGHSRIETLRARVNEFFRGRLDGDSAAFLMAVTTGERAGMSHELREAFNASGLAHLLSISGTHFGLLWLMLFGLFRLLIGFLPYRTLERLTVHASAKQAAALMSIPFMLLYLYLSGVSIPALRSFIMIGLFLAGILIGRKRLWLTSLLLAAFIIVLYDTRAILDISFLMSFSAVLFIGFLVEGKKKEPRSIRKYPMYAVLTSIAATIGTAPLVAYFFHRVSIISPIANLLVTPIVGFILVPASLISGVFHAVTGLSFSLPLLSPITGASVWLVRAFGSAPYSEVRLPAFPAFIALFYYLCFLCYYATKRRYILALPIVLIAIYVFHASVFPRPLTAVFLSAGEGDSSVVELPDSKTLVIDTGRNGRKTAAYLNYAGATSIDALVITHSHIDHAGGLGYIGRRFDVKEVWGNGEELKDIPGHAVLRRLVRGDFVENRYESGSYSITALHPYDGFNTKSDDIDRYKNNSSLVIKIKNKKSFLFAGDIEKEACEDLMILSKELKSDVLKVPHHGLKSSLHEGFLNAVSPSVAIVTSKRLNPSVREALGPANIYLTGLDGSIKIEDREDGLRVKRYDDYRLKRARTPANEIKNLKALFTVW